MPTKDATSGQPYTVTDKTFTWTTENGDEVTIPLRVKLKVIRALSGRDMNDVDTMFDILDAIIPGQADVLDEMDMNDFVAMFTAWNTEYNALTGASLGEPSPSRR